MDTAKEWENYLFNLKDGDLPFLNEEKFTGLIKTIIDVLSIQTTVGKFNIDEKSKELGSNFLDTDLSYGYIYGFCDAISRSSIYTGVKEIFVIWTNVVRHLTKVTNNVKEFSPYFSLIQTKFIKDKKSEFYKGCEVGGGDAVDWLKRGESVLGLLILLETHKFKRK